MPRRESVCKGPGATGAHGARGSQQGEATAQPAALCQQRGGGQGLQQTGLPVLAATRGHDRAGAREGRPASRLDHVGARVQHGLRRTRPGPGGWLPAPRAHGRVRETNPGTLLTLSMPPRVLGPGFLLHTHCGCFSPTETPAFSSESRVLGAESYTNTAAQEKAAKVPHSPSPGHPRRATAIPLETQELKEGGPWVPLRTRLPNALPSAASPDWPRGRGPAASFMGIASHGHRLCRRRGGTACVLRGVHAPTACSPGDRRSSRQNAGQGA